MAKPKLTWVQKFVLIVTMVIFTAWLIYAVTKQDTMLYISAILYLACTVLVFLKIIKR